MNLHKKVIVALLLLVCYSSFGQHEAELVRPKSSPPTRKLFGKNDIRLGLYFTRITLTYDRALTNKWSVGIEGVKHAGTFPGYEVSALGRYYFKSFDKKGFFLEEKITYGHFKPTVYDSVVIDNLDDETYAWGQHIGNLNYLGNTLSIGYRVFVGRFLFFEFLVGGRTGILKCNKNDKQMLTGDGGLGYSNPTLRDEFYLVGPGCPIYFNIRLGAKF